METLAELEQWLEANCYSFTELSIGKHRALEGIILEKNGAEYHFSSAERGHTEVLRAFGTEKELVQYALAELQKDDWWQAHLAAATGSESEIHCAERELERLGIRFRRNDIPVYRSGRPCWRLFVFGRDILRLDDFKRRYLHPPG